MNRESIHRKISEIIELLEVNNNRLFLHDEELSEFDLEYLKKLTLSLYEQIDGLVLNVKNAPVIKEIQEKEPPPPVAEPEEQSEEQVGEVEDVTEEDVSESEPGEVYTETDAVQETEEILIEDAYEEEVQEDEEPTSEEEEPNEQEPVKEEIEADANSDDSEELVDEEIDEPAETGSKKPESTPSAGDQAQLFGNENLNDRLRLTKIESVKRAISVSKRFEFQNALFDKNAEQYNKHIDALDSTDSLDSAKELFEQLASEYDWDPEEELVQELQTILLRRYM